MQFQTLRFILACLLVLQMAGCELNIGGDGGHGGGNRGGRGGSDNHSFSEHRGGHG